MYLLSSRRYLSIFVWLLILARFALTLLLTAEVYMLDNWTSFAQNWGWVMVADIAINPVIDVIIAGGLFHSLKKRSFGLSPTTLVMIRQLIQWTIGEFFRLPLYPRRTRQLIRMYSQWCSYNVRSYVSF
jgi:hypothetical protein